MKNHIKCSQLFRRQAMRLMIIYYLQKTPITHKNYIIGSGESLRLFLRYSQL